MRLVEMRIFTAKHEEEVLEQVRNLLNLSSLTSVKKSHQYLNKVKTDIDGIIRASP